MITMPDGQARTNERLREHAQQLDVTALIVTHQGQQILKVGDVSRPLGVHSIRKSLMSALYGHTHGQGLIDLETTLADLDIDETPALTRRRRP
jgi:hypothetical protein